VITLGEKKQSETKETENRFTKQQILKSKKYAAKRDALAAILDDVKTYTHAEIEAELKKFYGGAK